MRNGAFTEFRLLREEENEAVASAVTTNEFLVDAAICCCEEDVPLVFASPLLAAGVSSPDSFFSSVVDSCTFTPMMSSSCCAMSASPCSERIRGSVRANTLPTAFEIVFRRPMIVCFCVTWFSSAAWSTDDSSSSDVSDDALPL